MERHYESEKLIEFIKQNTPHINGETALDCVERAIREAPTANVVPRERFDRVFGNLKAVLEERSEDRAEVAREIFEEIKKFDRRPISESKAVYVIKESEFAELKKKYTGDQT